MASKVWEVNYYDFKIKEVEGEIEYSEHNVPLYLNTSDDDGNYQLRFGDTAFWDKESAKKSLIMYIKGKVMTYNKLIKSINDL